MNGKTPKTFDEAWLARREQEVHQDVDRALAEIREDMRVGASAVTRAVRRYRWWLAAGLFGAGLLVGVLKGRR